jgi:hypothetical protein
MVKQEDRHETNYRNDMKKRCRASGAKQYIN